MCERWEQRPTRRCCSGAGPCFRPILPCVLPTATPGEDRHWPVRSRSLEGCRMTQSAGTPWLPGGSRRFSSVRCTCYQGTISFSTASRDNFCATCSERCCKHDQRHHLRGAIDDDYPPNEPGAL